LIYDWGTHCSAFQSKRHIDLEPQANTEKEFIEISSDEELEDEVKGECNKSMVPLKKRTLSNSATQAPPSKRRITTLDSDTIEVLDSDDEHPTAMKAVPTKDSDPTMDAFAFSDTRPVTVKVESGSKKMASSSNEAAKNKDGRYIVTQKVKVDSIKNLHEVPTRWPITPEGTNTAYVIDLNNDEKWQKLDPNSKKKHLDRFIKQEVCPNILCH
jgi:hypothetical protein